MSKFGAKTSAFEVIEGHNLTGYEVIVTGASSGIGVETARAFVKAGARVILTGRDDKKTEEVAADIRQTTGSDKVEVEHLELDSLASVNEFVSRFVAKNRPLHILVNNAGVMACPLSYTRDGFETQFGTNHMGHFALTVGLLPSLKEGHKQSGRNSRVVNLSSASHRMSDIIFEDINYQQRPYVVFEAYGQSKTANVLFSIELTNRFANYGIYSNAVSPGIIHTDLTRHIPKQEMIDYGWIDQNGNPVPNPSHKTIEQGASTTVWAAVAPELENIGGKYLEDCSISKQVTKEEIFKTYTGHLEYVCNQESAARLWNMSEDWIKNPPIQPDKSN